MFDRHLALWDLAPDGAPIVTSAPASSPQADERGVDYANLFCNPDVADPSHAVATLPDHFAKRLEIVAQTGMDRLRLLHWIIAWTGLSAAWFIGDGMSPETDFRIAELAIAELDR